MLDNYNPCLGCGGEDCCCCEIWLERQRDFEYENNFNYEEDREHGFW